MSTAVLSRRSPFSMGAILAFDAATCLGMSALLLVATTEIAGVTGLPPGLARAAGLALVPIAAFIAVIACRPSAWGTALVVAGNGAWVAASLLLVVSVPGLTGVGVAFVLLQAAVVALLAALELRGRREAKHPPG